MVTAVGHRGLRDWLLQRISAVVLALYLIGICLYVTWYGGMDYQLWHGLHKTSIMKNINILALFSLSYHAYIGLWTVITDYLKITWLRLCAQGLVYLILLVCLLDGCFIIVGVS